MRCCNTTTLTSSSFWGSRIASGIARYSTTPWQSCCSWKMVQQSSQHLWLQCSRWEGKQDIHTAGLGHLWVWWMKGKIVACSVAVGNGVVVHIERLNDTTELLTFFKDCLFIGLLFESQFWSCCFLVNRLIIFMWQVLTGLDTASQNAVNAAAFRQAVPQEMVIGLFRDLRGVVSAANSLRPYGNSFHPRLRMGNYASTLCNWLHGNFFRCKRHWILYQTTQISNRSYFLYQWSLESLLLWSIWAIWFKMKCLVTEVNIPEIHALFLVEAVKKTLFCKSEI